MSVEVDLVDGIAAMLQTAGIGVPGASTGTAIVSKALNPQPDRGIAIVVGGVGDNAKISNGTRTVQFRFRGSTDDRVVDELAQQVFDLLHGISAVLMGNTMVAHLYRTSFVSLGRDDNNRWERSDNYLADIAEPPTANRPD